MPEITSYPTGTPNWVDLASPDLEASKAFYGGLFGWGANPVPDPEAGGYTMFTRGDKVVAGLGPQMMESQPPSWTTYVAVDDANKAAEAVLGAGGRVYADPMDIFTAGRMAVFGDPTGAAFAVWQPAEFAGAQVANEPGSFCWSELDTRDVAAAKEFYPAVFGWSCTTSSTDESPFEYYEWRRDGTSVGGMMPMPAEVPDMVPSYWLTYFAVSDTDIAVDRVRELGGSLMVGPVDIPAGRFAVVGGPHGEAFGIIKI
jgi:hypothetical protein